GLGLVQAHGGAQAAVEVDDRELVEDLLGVRRLDRDVLEQRWVQVGVDRVLGYGAGDALLELFVIVGEDVDRGLCVPGFGHLLLRCGESVGAHGTRVSVPSCAHPPSSSRGQWDSACSTVRSWLASTTAALVPSSAVSRSSTPLMPRWLVGSSSSTTAGRSANSALGARRRRSPGLP